MIAVIDYKMGNLRSVAKALEKAGAEVLITAKKDALKKARAIVLPGVGAFGQGMKHLKDLGVIPSLISEIKQGKPFLGICLGLQLLFTRSREHGMHKGLGVLQGEVGRFPARLKVPHMGWNHVKIQSSIFKLQMERDSCIMRGIPDNSYFYFVHSYYVVPRDKNIVVAKTNYGVGFSSVIQKDNIWGVQFHPEKSQELGLRIIKNFVNSV